ncbi:MAG: hypothetical protein Q9164_001271 [Protoblastenia rupestris]
MIVCHALSIPIEIRPNPTNVTRSTIPLSFTFSRVDSWSQFVDVGVRIIKRKVPDVHLILVAAKAPSDVQNVHSLQSYLLLAADQKPGHIELRGDSTRGWQKPQRADADLRGEATMTWPPRFDIVRALELSRDAGIQQGFHSVQLVDEEEIGMPDYSFASLNGPVYTWIVRTKDEVVIHDGEMRYAQARTRNGTLSGLVGKFYDTS